MIEESEHKYRDTVMKPNPYNLFAILITAPYGNWLQNTMNKYNIKATREYFEYYISGKKGAPDYMELFVKIWEEDFEEDLTDFLNILQAGPD